MATSVVDPWHLGVDPYPRIHASDNWIFCLFLFEGTFTSFFKDKKSKRSNKTVEIKVFLTQGLTPTELGKGFSYYFCLMIEGAGAGSIPLTNGSGSGFTRPKNMWIRIRRRNTGERSPSGRGFCLEWPRGLVCIWQSVLWIHDILVWIRIRGSMPLTSGSGYKRSKKIWIQRIRIWFRIRNTAGNTGLLYLARAAGARSSEPLDTWLPSTLSCSFSTRWYLNTAWRHASQVNYGWTRDSPPHSRAPSPPGDI